MLFWILILDLGIWIIGLIFFNLGIWVIGFDYGWTHAKSKTSLLLVQLSLKLSASLSFHLEKTKHELTFGLLVLYTRICNVIGENFYYSLFSKFYLFTAGLLGPLFIYLVKTTFVTCQNMQIIPICGSILPIE